MDSNFNVCTELGILNFLSTISSDSRFVKKRQEFLDFGDQKFMKLLDLRRNFPFEDDNGNYSVEHSDKFAWATTLSFLLEYFPEFLLPYKKKLKDFDTSILKSVYFRSQFLYFKYYVHKQRPQKSDFMDYVHISYFPYLDAYVTEKNVLEVLTHMKSTTHRMPNCELFHVSSFVENVECSSYL